VFCVQSDRLQNRAKVLQNRGDDVETPSGRAISVEDNSSVFSSVVTKVSGADGLTG